MGLSDIHSANKEQVRHWELKAPLLFISLCVSGEKSGSGQSWRVIRFNFYRWALPSVWTRGYLTSWSSFIVPQADLKCFPDASLWASKEEKAQGGIKAKHSPRGAGLWPSGMGGRGKGALCHPIKDALRWPLRVALGRGQSPLADKRLLGGYITRALSVAVLSSSESSIMLKGPGGRGGEGRVCYTYLDTVMCKERLCIRFCRQLKAGGFAPVLTFPH